MIIDQSLGYAIIIDTVIIMIVCFTWYFTPSLRARVLLLISGYPLDDLFFQVLLFTSYPKQLNTYGGINADFYRSTGLAARETTKDIGFTQIIFQMDTWLKDESQRVSQRAPNPRNEF